MESTLEGMAKLSDDNKSIIIGIPGLYRVTAVLNWTSYGHGGQAHCFCFKINGEQVTYQYAGRPGGYGTIDRIFDLKKDDKLGFYTNNRYATNANYNSFTLQKL